MRLFAALELPNHVVDRLQAWWLEASAVLSPADWRAVPPHLWHLTLAFYGEFSAGEADNLSEQLSDCAALAPLIHLQTGDFGVFPHLRRPRVFWAGANDIGEENALKRLARCCRRAGHATVRKQSAGEAAFRAHITLARSRFYGDKAGVKAIGATEMQALPPVPGIDWCADCMCLFQSVLRPEGPQYRRLEIFKLKCSRDETRGTYDR